MGAARDLYSAVASELDFLECSTEDGPDNGECDIVYCVCRTWDLRQRLCDMAHSSWVTRYMSAPDLCEKSNLAKLVSRCSSLSSPADWDFFPRTWHLPEQYDIVLHLLQRGANTYIVKPKNG